jgi:hypothetical protein
MAIKGGDLLHVGKNVLLERIQTGGPGQVNLSPEKVYELGNYLGVATIFDIPDITFSLDSIDATAQLEALLVGSDFATDADGTAYDPATAIPFDVLGQVKPGVNKTNKYDVVGSAVTPYLTLETLSYRFGLRDKATQSAGLRGDAVYYNPSGAFYEEFAGTNTANQVVTLTHDAYPYNGDVIAGTRYALGVSLASGKRLFYGEDYTEAPTGAGPAMGVAITIINPVAASDFIRVVYATDTTMTYPQASHEADAAIHPAAIRGKDITVYVNGTAITDRWSMVQQVNLDWRVTLDQDRQFGASQLVGQDFFVPAVTGSIQVKPRDYADLFTKIREVAGVATATEVAGPLNTTPMEVLVVLHAPQDGSILKCIEVPDARITVPGYQGQVQQKLMVTFNIESDTGQMKVYKGAKAGLPVGA